MLPLRHEKHWRLAGIVLLLVVLAATILPMLWLWQSTSKVLLDDKWLHFFTFLFLSLWFAGQYARRSYWILMVGLTAFGVLIELVQSMIPYRSAELMDLVADVGGIGIGLAIALTGLGGWSLRFEQWLEKARVSSD
jgi:VanZ family protein